MDEYLERKFLKKDREIQGIILFFETVIHFFLNYWIENFNKKIEGEKRKK